MKCTAKVTIETTGLNDWQRQSLAVDIGEVLADLIDEEWDGVVFVDLSSGESVEPSQKLGGFSLDSARVEFGEAT